MSNINQVVHCIQFLFTGGRIDHAHHATNAYKSLYDTIALADAVQAAVDHTSESDTLIVTSADHSHVFTVGGYPTRGNNILGKDFFLLKCKVVLWNTPTNCVVRE